MSRPFRLFLPVAFAALSLGFTACVGTVYDPVYSNRLTHYKPPAEKKEASAADILNSVDSSKKGGQAPDGLPAAPDAVPGMGLPPAMTDPAAPAPGAMPAIPGLPPPVPAPAM